MKARITVEFNGETVVLTSDDLTIEQKADLVDGSAVTYITASSKELVQYHSEQLPELGIRLI